MYKLSFTYVHVISLSLVKKTCFFTLTLRWVVNCLTLKLKYTSYSLLIFTYSSLYYKKQV